MRSKAVRATLAASVWLMLCCTLSAQEKPPAEPNRTAPPAPICDVDCVRKNITVAVSACAPRIEAEAPGDFDWLFRPYGTIFQQADTPEQPTSSVVRYRGDSIRVIDPRERWVRVIYECGFDTATKTVAYVRTKLGVLGKVSAIPALAGTQPQNSAQRPGPVAHAKPLPAPAGASASIDLRRIGEPSEVDIRQIPPGTRPPRPGTTAPATGQ